MEGIFEFLSNTPPATILFFVGIALVILGLVSKIPLGKERVIEIEPGSRRIALTIGLVFVAGATVWLIVPIDNGNGPPTPTPSEIAVTTISPIAPEESPTAADPTQTATAAEDPKDLLKQTVIAYYGFLNTQAYKEAWDLLSPEFQQTRQQNGIIGFEAYWRTVDEVEIFEFEPPYISPKGDVGEVVVSLIWHSNNTSSDVHLRFCLLFNDFQREWLINRVVGTDIQC